MYRILTEVRKYNLMRLDTEEHVSDVVTIGADIVHNDSEGEDFYDSDYEFRGDDDVMKYEKMYDQKKWTLVSDRQKRLIPAVHELLPDVEYRHCYFNTHQSNPPPLPDSTMAKFSGSSSVILLDEISGRQHIIYFMSLLSSYLSLQCEDLCVVEIYSLHRFTRQFGFCQYLPGEHSEELPISVLERSKVDVEIVAMDDDTNSERDAPLKKSRMGLQLVSILVHIFLSSRNWMRSPQGVSTNPAKLVLNAENLFIGVHNFNQSPDTIGDRFGSIHFIVEGATLDGPESKKRVPVMPTTGIFAQPVLHELAAPSIFNVSAIAFEQHRKATLSIGERIQQRILGTSFVRLLEYSDGLLSCFE
ncbi:hypothetical protein ACH5RR_012948 [Cinchona calisaya]|uniref:Uncharacterized protein n=1 Tax=Cinchona calisaya TaxID=153742 RepID=A0ABD3A0U8_9GENT